MEKAMNGKISSMKSQREGAQPSALDQPQLEGVENGRGDAKNTGQHGEAFETAERNEEPGDSYNDREK